MFILKLFKPVNITYSTNLHIPALDGVRGIAIFLVLLYHCFYPLRHLGSTVGWVGVDLFFVLSGFLITGILLDTRQNKNYFKTFYLRRSLRIFPLYYLFLIFFFILSPILLNPTLLKPYQYYFDNQIWYWLYIPNWLITFNNHWPPVPKPLLDHFWSLAIEEQFYLFWPFLVFICNRKVLGFICLFFIFQSILIRNIFENIGQDYSSSYVFTFARLDAISIGALIAIMIRSEKGKIILEKYTALILTVSTLILILITLINHNFSLKDEYFIRIGYTVIGFFFGSFLLFALVPNSPINKVSEVRFFRFLGKYSYGIYIYHWLIFPLFIDYIAKWIEKFTSKSIWLIASFICVGFIILLAVITFHIFEKQFLKLKKWAV